MVAGVIVMKRFFRSGLLLLLSGVLLWFLADAAAVRTAAAEALRLCAGSVIPALLPFLIVSDLLISLEFDRSLSPRLSGLMALYGLPGCAGSALLLGLIGGYPIGARTAAALYRQGRLTRPEAECLLSFCNNSNPVFLISVLGVGVFGSRRIGVWLWLIHLLSALLTGLLFRRRRSSSPRERPPVPPEPPALTTALSGALARSASSMLSISVCVLFFYVLLTPLRSLAGQLPSLLIGLTELFSLTPRLTADLPGLVLAAGCAGWGGCSVLLQTAAVLQESGLSRKPCLRGKALQGLLSALLAWLFSRWILA